MSNSINYLAHRQSPADHQIGAEATHVTVTVSETCSAVAYNPQEVTQNATHLLSTTASQRLEAGYSVPRSSTHDYHISSSANRRCRAFCDCSRHVCVPDHANTSARAQVTHCWKNKTDRTCNLHITIRH